MKNFNFENKIRKTKEITLNEYVSEFKKMAASLEYPIEKGVVEQVALLNALGYHTIQSCERHLDGHCEPYAWISIGSNTEKTEAELDKEHKSIYWNVERAAREEANKLFSPELESEEWEEAYIKARNNHENSKEYNEIIERIFQEIDDNYDVVKKLKDDFLEYLNDPNQNALSQRGRGGNTIEFVDENLIDKGPFSEEEALLIHKKSNLLLEKFKEFLKNRYYSKL